MSRGFGFVSYDNFESADTAIQAMDNQYLMNKQVRVSYALKKDGRSESHGSAAGNRALCRLGMACWVDAVCCVVCRTVAGSTVTKAESTGANGHGCSDAAKHHVWDTAWPATHDGTAAAAAGNVRDAAHDGLSAAWLLRAALLSMRRRIAHSCDAASIAVAPN